MFRRASPVHHCYAFCSYVWVLQLIHTLHPSGHVAVLSSLHHILSCLSFANRAPDPVIFILISTEITSPFQWHSWISKLRPGSIIPFQIMHMHHIPHPAYHTMFVCGLFTMLCASFRCCFFGLVPVTSRLGGPIRLCPFIFFMDSFFFLAGFQAR